MTNELRQREELSAHESSTHEPPIHEPPFSDPAVAGPVPQDRAADYRAADDPVAGDELVGDPAFDDPAVGDPAFDDQAFDDQAFDDRAVADPVVGDEVVGDPAFDDRAVGDPAFDDRAAGDPVVGGEAVGDPAVADPALVADPRPSERPAAVAGAATPAFGTLWPADEADGFQTRWREVQLRFVDDPPGATAEAESLASEVLDRFTAAVAAHKEKLGAWREPSGEPAESGADTERMRLAVREYRQLLDHLFEI